MAHYTKKFLEAYQRVTAAMENEGEQAGKECFRLEMLKLGHDERIRNLYRIKDKLSAKAMFFQLNAGQEHYLTTRKGRDIILKPRQIGYTTLAAVRGLDKAIWETNMSCGIMAHHQGVVTTIFNDLVKFTYNWFKRDWGKFYKPTEKSDSATELAFSDDGLGRILDSSIRVLYDFRGKTPYLLHVAEASRVEDDRLLGSCNGVPITGEVVLESTANGMGGQYHRLWQLWKSDPVTAPYKGHFIPWFAMYPERPEDWVKDETVKWTEYEEGLLKAEMGIEVHHLLWRRWCIAANCNGDPDQFEIEYPSNDVDCFRSGEHGVFPSSLIKMQERHNRPPTHRGFLIQDGTKTTLHEDNKGNILIWNNPDPAETYVIGCDPSGGVGKDAGAAFVKSQQKKRIVAAIYGDLDPADMARELYKLGTYYNKAWVCVEANNHGHVVIQELKNRNYTNMYKRTVLDELTAKPTKKIGFLTTNESKLRITEQFKNSCKNGDITIPDAGLVAEMSTFCQLASKNGKTIKREAQPGCKDDRVMAACLTEEMDKARSSVLDTFETTEASAMRDAEIDPFTGYAYG